MLCWTVRMVSISSSSALLDYNCLWYKLCSLFRWLNTIWTFLPVKKLTTFSSGTLTAVPGPCQGTADWREGAWTPCPAFRTLPTYPHIPADTIPLYLLEVRLSIPTFLLTGYRSLRLVTWYSAILTLTPALFRPRDHQDAVYWQWTENHVYWQGHNA